VKLNRLSRAAAPVAMLQAGDSTQNLRFDSHDLVITLQHGKYLSGTAATWEQGDWDGAPGGSPGSPPVGNGFSDQLDIIASLSHGLYLTGPYAPGGSATPLPPLVASGGSIGDGQTSIVYNSISGNVSVDPPSGAQLTSLHIVSPAGIFTGAAADQLGGSFDNDTDTAIFKATFGSAFGAISFGAVAPSGLSEASLLGDIRAEGSLDGGGTLGSVDLVYLTAQIFSDGFESGFASYWSGAPWPVGDDCINPIFTRGGTIFGDLADNTVAGDIDSSCGNLDTIDAWYVYAPWCDGTMRASTCDSGIDTVVAVFSACNSRSEVACNDDYCKLQSEVELPTSSGDLFLIRVSAVKNATGDFALELSCF